MNEEVFRYGQRTSLQEGNSLRMHIIERFNHTCSENVLDACLFDDILQVRTITEKWILDYYYNRPHEALNQLSSIKYQELFNFESLD